MQPVLQPKVLLRQHLSPSKQAVGTYWSHGSHNSQAPTAPSVQQTPSAAIPKVVLASEYFAGMNLSQKKIATASYVQFSYSNKTSPRETMVRQSSLSLMKESEAPKTATLQRSTSDREIKCKQKPIIPDNYLRGPPARNEKAKNLRNMIQYKNFQDLRPKTTISSGDEQSESDASEVIETLKGRLLGTEGFV